MKSFVVKMKDEKPSGIKYLKYDDSHFDLKPFHINLFCKAIALYVNSYPSELLYAVLPSTFDEYWNEVRGNVRTDWRKAKQHGYFSEELDKIDTETSKEIIEIFKSKDSRQGRPINWSYVDLSYRTTYFSDEWPVRNYRHLVCPDHNMRVWVTKKKDEPIAAFLELITCGNLAIVHVVMGHGDFLKDGIMKYLFMEVIKKCIERKIEYFSYGFAKHLITDSKFFMRDLRIVNQYAGSKC